jgi:hypothetical protein
MIGQIYPAADDALCLGRGAPVVPGRGLRAIQGEMVAPDIDLQEPDACCLSVAKVSGIGPPAHLRTREGMAIARPKGKLRGKSPKLSDKQQTELRRMPGVFT